MVAKRIIKKPRPLPRKGVRKHVMKKRARKHVMKHQKTKSITLHPQIDEKGRVFLLSLFFSPKHVFFGLPPPLNPTTKTIVLDLDRTLIYATLDHPPPPNGVYDINVRPVIGGVPMEYFVLKRRGFDEFLEFLGDKFEVIVFTASVREYADPILDELDTNNVISHRLYRESCKNVNGYHVKDLSKMGRDLKNMVIVDDNPTAFMLQPENGIQVRPFVGDLMDTEVWRLMGFFENECPAFDDFRDALMHFAPYGWPRVAWNNVPWAP